MMLMIFDGRCDADTADIIGRTVPLTDPLALLQQGPKAQVLTGLREENETKPEEEGKEEGLILCRSCRHPVTSSSQSLEVNGSHHHTFPNPLGIVFRIGCFAIAAGCVKRGRPTGEFSWFPGFSWCFALCSNCRAHLGWHYSSGSGKNFYGLIMGQLMGNG
jgi:hypothetical protein